ncbi:MAG: DegQ family serine endoprotease [Pseudomonadota bacterium]
MQSSIHLTARLGAFVRLVAVSAMLAIPAAPAALAQTRDAPGSFADLAERLSPAVVNISTSQTVDRPQPPQGVPEGSPFEDLFRDFFERGQPRGPRQVQSLGSGFVISADGFIVTNNHVIREADEIAINFADGSSLDATLVGTDPKTDIALLKVEPEAPLTFVRFGDSDAARVGDWVLAIGNPFGLGGSVSAGIISARNRDIRSGPYDDFLQTDAAINRGNSGGPLFNLNGDVIGVNTAIISPTGGSIGIGFAVPATLAENVVGQLRQFGETRRGWLGVRIQEVSDDIAETLDLSEASGALVASVTADGPAEDGGIEPGDVILRFDGKPVQTMRDLPRMVAETPVGKTVRVVVFRKGKTQTVRVTLGRLEAQELEAAAGSAPAPGVVPQSLDMSALGMSLMPLTPEMRARHSIADDVSGVLVESIDEAGPAGEKGISAGDVIVEIGQEPVNNPSEVAKRIEGALAAGRSSVLLLIQSGEDLRFVPLPVS